MLSRLRRKFILICMAMAGTVLLAVLALLIGTTVHQQNAQADAALTMALQLRPDMDEPKRFPAPDEALPPLHLFHPQEKGSFYSAFCVELDEQGSILSAPRMNLTLSDEDVSTAVGAALQDGRDEGTLWRLGLSYRCAAYKGGMRIAFADRTMDGRMLFSLLLTCAGVFVLAMLALFAASMYLSRWALKPVQTAWEQQRQFVADASHELKTPLTVILANTALLLDHKDAVLHDPHSSTQRRWLENTREEGLRMKKLVDDLLYLAKSDADRIRTQRTQISLTDAVWSAVLPFESVAFEKQQELVTDIAPDIVVCADAAQLHQAISILMDNACKYAPAGGRITAALKKQPGKALLTVHNTGEPIPPQALPHLFERFYRADASRSHDSGGYGLGLSILRTLCQQNGCKVLVDSAADQGTTFTLIFTL